MLGPLVGKGWIPTWETLYSFNLKKKVVKNPENVVKVVYRGTFEETQPVIISSKLGETSFVIGFFMHPS